MSAEGSLRIVHCFRAPVGGVFRHVRDLAEAQTRMGHAVGLVCDATTGGAYEAGLVDELGKRLELGITRVPMQRTVGLGDLAAARRTFQAVRALRPDVLHGHGAKGGVYARLFGTLIRPRARRFYSPHGGSLHYDPGTAKGKAIFAVERALEKMSDGLFFVCAFEKEVYERKIGPPGPPAHVVYNGLRDAEFEPVPPDNAAFDILFIGEMRELKGPDLLVAAIPLAEARLGRRLRTLMVGAGARIDSLRAQAEGLGLQDRVEFRPPMSAREAFAFARLVTVPSRSEAFPYIVLEALGASRSVIASSVGGIPEVFGTGSPALIEPNRDSLADKLAAALADFDGFSRAMPSPQSLRQRFSVETMAGEITRAYADTAGN